METLRRLNSRFPRITVEAVTIELECLVDELKAAYAEFVEDATNCTTIREYEEKCRRHHALFDAARRANPHFIDDPDYGYVWNMESGGDQPSQEDLIEWFKKTHAREARKIEDAIDGLDAYQS